MCAAAFSSSSVLKYVRPLCPMRDVESTSATSPSRRPLPLGSLSMYAATKSRSFLVVGLEPDEPAVAELAAQAVDQPALERERERARERAVRRRRACGLVNVSSVGMFGAILTPDGVSSWPPSQRVSGARRDVELGAGPAELERR